MTGEEEAPHKAGREDAGRNGAESPSLFLGLGTYLVPPPLIPKISFLSALQETKGGGNLEVASHPHLPVSFSSGVLSFQPGVGMARRRERGEKALWMRRKAGESKSKSLPRSLQ